MSSPVLVPYSKKTHKTAEPTGQHSSETAHHEAAFWNCSLNMWNNTLGLVKLKLKIEQVCEKSIPRAATEVCDPYFYYYERIYQNE